MPSTRSVCGTFPEVTRPDYGQCNPRRLKKDCEDPYQVSQVIQSPIVDGSVCEDPILETEIHPELVPPIRIIGTIFDTDCDAIEDTDGNPITGPTY